MVGIGLLLMTRLNDVSSWIHLVPGFIVAGLGAGLVNPPLASAAISVVPPQRAGMTSGSNTTFRQIGIAAGIAALGTILSTAMQHNLTAWLARVPTLAGSAPRIVTLVPQSQMGPCSVGCRPGYAVRLPLRSSPASRRA